MWLSKKKKKDTAENCKTISDKVAGKIAGAGIKMQQLFAGKMNKLFENMNVKRIKILLIGFCVIAGGFSLYLLANSIFQKDNKQQVFKIEQVDVPKHFDKTGDEIITPEAVIDERTYLQIRYFKKYMDSIQVHRKREYDSILVNRPGLLDSVQMLEQIYLSQKQK
jgi:hypothetical protein